MEFSAIQSGVLALIDQLQHAGLGQIEGLAQFVSVAMVDQVLDLGGLRTLLQSATVDKMRSLVDFANRRFGPGSDGNASMVPKSAEYQFGVIYNIYLLKEMFTNITPAQLTKIVDLVPPVQGPAQLQHLQDLQQLLLQLEVGQFMQIKAEIEQIRRENPGEEAAALPQLVELGVSHFHLYETLREMLALSEADFVVIQSTYPGWSHLHLGLLSKLKQLSLYEFRDMAKLLATPAQAPVDDEKSDDMEVEPPSGSVTSGARTTGALSLTITDQPPEKCVYKRNIKPPPSITVEGDAALFDGSVYVVPILSRCDTAEDLLTLMAGNSPVKLTNTRTITFGKLKILSTTHQMNETMFALRFELRAYERNGQQYKVLDTVTTDPFTVVSHSTQLKPSHKNLPTVMEVIPYNGPPTGSTRVAILGVNFQDSPTTRVRFDNIEVIPIFHGPKTLLCHTPKHEPGVVQVVVCNEPNAWSVNAGSFTFNERSALDSEAGSHKVAHAFSSANTPPAMHDFNSNNTSLFESLGAPKLSQSQGMDFDLTSSGFFPNKLDARGFAPLHCLAAVGNMEAISALSKVAGATPMVQDKDGNTALHWAVRHGQLQVALALLQSAPALVNIVNFADESPLHWAVRNGDDQLSLKLALGLVQRSAAVDCQDASGLTPLHLAIAGGHVKMAELLLRCGADVLAATVEDSLSALHFAAIYNRPTVIRTAARFGACLNPLDEERESPLHWAYRCDSQEVAATLLSLGADSSLKNIDGELPEQLSAQNVEPSPDVVQVADCLKAPGCDVPVSRVHAACTPAPFRNSALLYFGVYVQ